MKSIYPSAIRKEVKTIPAIQCNSMMNLYLANNEKRYSKRYSKRSRNNCRKQQICLGWELVNKRKTKDLEGTSLTTLQGWGIILVGERVAATETQTATDHEMPQRGRARADLQDPLLRWLRNFLSWLLTIFLSIYWLLCWKRAYWSHRGKLGVLLWAF